jgi:hypothetical protein
MSRHANTLDAIWNHVSNYGEFDKCWEWLGYVGTNGYGRITINYGDELVHRVAYQLAKGNISNGLFVCHSCDNRKCCNPDHLWLGTQADNLTDMYAKGRGPTGDKSGARKHPERLARGDRNGARKYPERLARGAAHHMNRYPEKVPRGATWAQIHTESRKGEHNGRAKLTESQVFVILNLRDKGFRHKDIAAVVGISTAVVGKICCGISWKHVVQQYEQSKVVGI